MSSPALHLVIDARPRGPRGPLAAEVVLGRTLLGRLLEQALTVAPPDRPIAVHAREEEHAHAARPGGRGRAGPGRASSPGRRRPEPPSCGPTGSTTPAGFAGPSARGRSLETAVIWRLDRGRSLADGRGGADAALDLPAAGPVLGLSPGRAAGRGARAHAGSAQRPDARRRRRSCSPRPALVAFAGPGPCPAALTAMALAVALVLDTADGRLARLQGTSSAFGRWLDQVLDELADLALHAAIAWSVFASTGQPGWLVLGMLYASGKYLFLIQSLAGEQLMETGTGDRAAEPETDRPGADARRPARDRRLLRRLVRLAGHADVRWHLWIVLAAGRAARPGTRRLRDLLPAPGAGRRAEEGGGPCLSPGCPS